LKSVEVNTYSLPILNKLFILFYEQKNIYKTVTFYLNEFYTSEENIINNFAQNEIWQKKKVNQPNKSIIPYFLYIDNYKINNVWGHIPFQKKLGCNLT